MVRRSLFSATAALVFLTPSAHGASAQEAGASPALIPQDSVQIVLTRFQTLQQKVGQLQQDVMDSSTDLQERQATVAGMVEDAVYEIDPDLQTAMQERMPAIQQEAQAAQAASDTTALQALQQEFVAIRTRADEAEQTALQRPAIATEVESFQQVLRSEMAARDPEIEATLDELEVLAGRLDLTLGDGG